MSLSLNKILKKIAPLRKKKLYFHLSLFIFLGIITAMIILSLHQFYTTFTKEKLADLEGIVQNQAQLLSEIYEVTQDQDLTIHAFDKTIRKVHQDDMPGSLTNKGELILGRRGSKAELIVLGWHPNKNGDDTVLSIDDKFLPLQLAIKGQNGSMMTEDRNGEPVMVAYAYVPSMRAGLVEVLRLGNILGLISRLGLQLLSMGIFLSLFGLLIFRHFEAKKNSIETIFRNEIEDTLYNLNAIKKAMDTHSLISMLDSKGRIRDVNSKLLEAVGAKREDLIGKSIEHFKSDEHDEAFYKKLWETITHENVWHGRVKVYNLKGKPIWLETTVAPARVKESNKLFYICIQNDITKVMEYEKNLRKQKQQAEVANARKSSFLAHISHEIRTPLSSIVGYIDLLEKNGKLEGKSRHYMNVARRNAVHLMNLIGEVLDLSKIESDELEIKKTRTPLLPEVIKLREMFINSSKDISFSVELMPPLPKDLVTDPLRLQQIILNLVGNAFKFTDQGSIRVTFRLSDPSLGEPHDKLAIQVTDTGPGISQHDQRRLFKPFERLRASTNLKKGGSGLGLHLSKEMAQLLGGDVKIMRSEVGVGTTFVAFIDFGDPSATSYFTTLPIALGSQPPKQPSGSKQVLLENARILVVEDSFDISELIRINLEAGGAQVAMTDNGETALRKINEESFDIILLDLHLPEMSGHEIIRKILKDHPDIPVIALTAQSTQAERTRCMNNGFSDFHAKPINFTKLCETITYWLEQSRKNLPNSKSHNENQNIYSPLYSSLPTDNPVIARRLKEFVESFGKKIETCAHLCSQKNWPELARYGHKIKGAFGSYGFPDLQNIASKIEDLCIDEQISSEAKQDQIQTLIMEMNTLSHRAQSVFQTSRTA